MLYSSHRISGEKGGDIGFITRAMLGDLAGPLFAAETGDWVGPIDTEAGFMFFQALDKYPMRKQTYEEVREEVRKQVRQQWRPHIYAQKTAQLRKSIPVQIFPEKLINL